MRKLSLHKTGGACNDIEVYVTDEPGHGGACHDYVIAYNLNPGTDEGGTTSLCDISFQNGPIKEFGVNGVTNESLLAVVADRLQCFQNGKFACNENANALNKVREAIFWLKSRTEDRILRNVEGKSVI